MKIQYLGTAAAEGWPGLFCRCEACRRAGELRGRNVRTRSQALIDGRLLLDFPCETYAHMLLHGVDLPNIHSCLITHCHEDHFYYLDLENRSKGYAQDMNGLLTLYGNDRMVQTLRDWSAGFSSPRQVDFRELPAYESAKIEDWTVTPVLARHNPRERCYNYIISDGSRTLFYAHDTGFPTEEVWQFLRRFAFDLVSLDCTCLMLDRRGGGHMSFQENLEVRDRMLREGIARPDTVFVANHFSHFGAVDPSGRVWLYEETSAMMAEKGFIMSWDGLTLEC